MSDQQLKTEQEKKIFGLPLKTVRIIWRIIDIAFIIYIIFSFSINFFKPLEIFFYWIIFRVVSLLLGLPPREKKLLTQKEKTNLKARRQVLEIIGFMLMLGGVGVIGGTIFLAIKAGSSVGLGGLAFIIPFAFGFVLFLLGAILLASSK